MPRFVVPDPDDIRSVLADSHALWGSGLSMPDYIGMWEELAASRWGRSWYGWRGLADTDGQIVSSLKLYRPLVRIGQDTGRLAAIGAVFTPPGFRRRGYAAQLIRSTLDEAVSRGDVAALLFTDIGTDYYAALGFTPLPCEDAVGVISPAAGGDARVSLRGMESSDLEAVALAHAASSLGRPLAIVRDAEHWQFLLERAHAFFRRLDGSSLGRRFMIAESEGRRLGYLVSVAAPGEWNLREAGAFDGDPGTLTRILAAGAAEAAASSAATVWGWIPRDVWPHVRAWKLRAQPRLRAIPMIRMLDGRALPDGLRTVQGAFIPYLDQF